MARTETRARKTARRKARTLALSVKYHVSRSTSIRAARIETGLITLHLFPLRDNLPQMQNMRPPEKAIRGKCEELGLDMVGRFGAGNFGRVNCTCR